MSLSLPPEIDNLSEQALRAYARENGEKARAIRGLYQTAIGRMNREIDRVDAMLADFTQRGGAMMTAAGLFTIFPFVSISDNFFLLQHFFLWVFPFVLISMVTFIVGSTRVHVRVTAFPTVLEGQAEELISLRDEMRELETAWKLQQEIYGRVLVAQRVSSTALTLYGMAFLIHYTLLIFFGIVLSNAWSAALFFLIAAYGTLHVWGNARHSETKRFGPFSITTTVLGLPPSQKL
jgi:hypothetical protein